MRFVSVAELTSHVPLWIDHIEVSVLANHQELFYISTVWIKRVVLEDHLEAMDDRDR